jgi:hypothetical protein
MFGGKMTEINLKDMVGKFVKLSNGRKGFVTGKIPPRENGNGLSEYQGIVLMDEEVGLWYSSAMWTKSGYETGRTVGWDVKGLWPEEKTYEFWVTCYKNGMYSLSHNSAPVSAIDKIACLHFTGTFKEGDGL